MFSRILHLLVLLGTGFPTKKADGTMAARSIAGTSGKVVVSNGDGDAGNPTITVGADIIQKDGSVAFAADQSLGGFKLTSVGTPTADGDAVTKAYADSLIGNLDWKQSVLYATTAALPSYTHSAGVLTASANGALSVDGASPSVGNRILVKDETAGNAPYNWLFTVTDAGSAGTPWILTRATDADQNAEVTRSQVSGVDAGTANAGRLFLLSASGAITLGTTSISVVQIGALTLGTSNPAVLGPSASAGSASVASKEDHVHPTTGLLRTDGANALAGDLTFDAAGRDIGSSSAAPDVYVRELYEGETRVSDADYTVLAGDNVIVVHSLTANRTITLPAASAARKRKLVIISDDANGAYNVLVVRAGSDTINNGESSGTQITIPTGDATTFRGPGSGAKWLLG